MEHESETKKLNDLSLISRRTWMGRLLAGGLYSTLGKSGFGGGLPQQSSEKSPDVGTIYDEVMKMADEASYPLSYLNGDYPSAEVYRRMVREKVFDLFHYDPPAVDPEPEVIERWEFDDYIQERVLFNTAPWFRIAAYVLTPKGYSGRRPGVVDLHSHGGLFVFGKEKVMPMPEGDHPSIVEYRQRNYDGRSTSLQLCRRGYVVVSIDCFYFGERRSFFDDDEANYGRDRSRYSEEDVQYLNRRSARGEGILARSLYWAGTTWQGVAHVDDIRTVDYLISRPDVDPERIGCLGISMGGDRTDYLAGLDERISCSVSIGWMSTLRPMIRNHVSTHSFMHFLPGLTHYVDLPDLLGCMVPKPLMVQYCSRDALYPLEGMEESAEKLAAIYSKAGAKDRFRGEFYDQPHIFSADMQEEAFAWFDRWLQP